MTVSFDFRDGVRREPAPVDRPVTGREYPVAREDQEMPPPAADAGPQALNDWNPGGDLNSVERLAAMLEARQRERDRRASGNAPSRPDEDAAPQSAPAGPDSELGERFGWEDRWSGEDVSQYLQDRREPAAKGWVWPLAGAGLLLGVSAAIAYLIVFAGAAPDQTGAPAATGQPAAEEPIAAAEEQFFEPEGPTQDAEVQLSGAIDPPATVIPTAPGSAPITFQPRAEAEAESPSSAPTMMSRDDIRMIMPAPHQETDEGESTAQPLTSEASGEADAEIASPVLQSREAGPSWIAPGPVAGEQAEPVDPVESAEPEEAPGGGVADAAEMTGMDAIGRSRVTVAVNMRAEPVNEGEVLAVIPADATIDLIGCDIWCEVAYDGQQGWVFRDFVTGAE